MVVMRMLACALVLLSGCQPAAFARHRAEPPRNTLPAATLVATRPPVATPTRGTKQAIEAYTIEGLRRHEFESGSVRVRETLDETEIFRRFLIEYPSDGLTIMGILQIPTQGTPPYPVLLLNHGYFYRGDYRSGDGTDRAAEYFNRRGYLTVSSDYRSWGGSEVGASLFYSGLVIDVINLLNALPSIPEADAARVGMWGHSMGGGVTIKVLTVDERVRAAVLYSSVSAEDADIIARWGSGCIGDVFAGELLIGCNSSDIIPPDLAPDVVHAYQQAAYDSDRLQEISAIFHLNKVVTPVQIAFGTDDGEVMSGTPPEWSKKLHAALQATGKESELFAYAGQRHSFVGDQWFAFMERSAQFFDRHLGPAS
jgi:dipeptidyl aminopeptidase/acylaminoacyl peptidase